MVGLFLCAGLVGQVTPTKVAYREGVFTVTGAHGFDSVPVVGRGAIPTKSSNLVARVGDTMVTFDDKGLTIATGRRKIVTKLTEVPTSGKIATKESNQELMRLVAEKSRSLAVSAVSGSELVEKVLYVLARWEDKSKAPWLEALVKIDLAGENPKPSLLAKLEGRSFAVGQLEDVLQQRGDKLALLANQSGRFGLIRLNMDGVPAEFEDFGEAVGKAKLSEDGSAAWTLTPTAYGTNILGIADLDQSAYHVVSEFRGKMSDVQFPAYARYKVGEKQRLVNLLTGAQTEIEPRSVLTPTSHGLLVYSPAAKPNRASLFDANFRRLAQWAASPTAPVRPPVLTSSGTAKKATKPASAPSRSKALPKPMARTSPKPGKPSIVKKPKTKAPPTVKVEVSSRASRKKQG